MKINVDIVTECLVALSWSEKANKAYFDSLAEYRRCGSPGIPLCYGSNYRAQWFKENGRDTLGRKIKRGKK